MAVLSSYGTTVLIFFWIRGCRALGVTPPPGRQAYLVMAYIVMVHVVTAYIVMATPPPSLTVKERMQVIYSIFIL